MVAQLQGPVDQQFVDLQRSYAHAQAHPNPDGTVSVQIPNIELPDGWSKRHVSARFVVPVGYPMAPPDCFWVDGDLRLLGGVQPKASGFTPMPHCSEALLWFSWHVNGWNPTSGTLKTYARVIEERLRRPE